MAAAAAPVPACRMAGKFSAAVQLGLMMAAIEPGFAATLRVEHTPMVFCRTPGLAAALAMLGAPTVFSWKEGARNDVPQLPWNFRPQPSVQFAEAFAVRESPNWS